MPPRRRLLNHRFSIRLVIYWEVTCTNCVQMYSKDYRSYLSYYGKTLLSYVDKKLNITMSCLLSEIRPNVQKQAKSKDCLLISQQSVTWLVLLYLSFEKNHRDWFTLFAWLYWIMLDWSHFWLFLDSCWRTLTETKKKKRSSTRRTRRGRQIRQKTGSTVGGTEDELTRPEIERRTSLRLKIIGLNREKTRWSEYWNKLLYWAVTIMDILFDIPF